MSKYMNLKEKSYEIIKHNIINLIYRPGEYLEEKKLSSSLEVSRTPMREALSRLEDEGWVNIYPRKGIYVAKIDETLINNVFEARKTLEISSLKLTAGRLPQMKLELLKEKFADLTVDDPKKLEIIDDEFHNMIISFYDNFFLKKATVNIMEHAKRIKMFSLDRKVKEVILKSKEEHIILIDLLLEEKIEEAEQLLYEHLERAQRYYLKILVV
ncbi:MULTISPECIES: GntR family transcriptional regulator [Psychrilyobacter]|uniref:GntR family transcriptional regulator n=1 Tax=Psychrilyobacter piezotolerans TaxID=2293438 RepID=A0ABX9KG92_9FUSO|nr:MULTISPECIES: GntR family transcriptional regulator [Psychrilyobacter]MCS5422277.1 GntR family transcriptional regulator [Psychrilyobacter sp. S5]NDI78303.1 GntR family transcriptional regulator [Psychrilyobacter piezotolerans]RDE60847.1 GntR family transcriptional regulator [Psychrilyobacter sp. S5]REI40636.1 GntR family transcriptional regulator [Psychrilyobacter piezotolerans]